MTATLKQVINSLQVPINTGLTMVELRAKAMQQLGMEPAISTPEEAGDGEPVVQTRQFSTNS